MAGRQRRGTLLWTPTKGGWSARIANGPTVRLHTFDRTLAEIRLAEYISSGVAPAAGAVETFQQASVRICNILERDGMRSVDDRRSRLRRYAWPHIGALPANEIKPGQISAVLEAAVKTGRLGQSALKHLKDDVCVVFRELVRDGVLETNPAAGDRIRVPKLARDKRRRVILTDDEFVAFINCATVDRALRTMAVASRAFGGLRRSDLYAWQWTDIDTVLWQWADAPRPKTEHHDDDEKPRARIELPPLVRDWLRRWWRDAGCPVSGAVFPRRIHNTARDLRRALWAAGVRRGPVPADCALQTDTPTSRRVDFHSFRRAFVTAVASAGLNAQRAMRLAGHRSMATHARYDLPEVLEIPAAAVPSKTAGVTPPPAAPEGAPALPHLARPGLTVPYHAEPDLDSKSDTDFDAALAAWQPN